MTTESLIVKLDAIIRDYEQSVDRATRKTDKLGKSATATSNSMNKFDLSAIAASVSVGLLTTKMVALSDAYTRSQNLLINVTNGTEDLKNTTEDLFNVAERSRASYESTATLYARLARATRSLNLTQQENLELTETLNKAFAAGGATAQEAAASTVQLSQALASGTLRGDEFNSISEQAPAILDAVAFATGRARGELKELAADGKITSEVLIRSIQAYQSSIENEFNKTTATFSDNLTLANNELLKTIGNLEIVTDVTGVAGRTLVTLASNVDTFATFAGSAAMALALTNLKSLNAVLRANPYIAAGTALAALTVAVSDFISTTADDRLKNAIAESVKSSVQQDIDRTTQRMQELSLEVQKAEKLLQGGSVAINTAETQDRITNLKAEIKSLVLELDQLQQKQAEIQSTAPEIDSGAGSVDIGGDDDQKVEKQDRVTESLKAQIKALEDGAQAAEIYKLTQEAANANDQERVNTITDLVNKKYELIEAKREEAELDAEAEALAGRLEKLEEFALTREEMLVEQYQKELEMLLEFQALTGASDEELYKRRLELAKKFAKDLQAIRGTDVKGTKEAEKDKERALRNGTRAAMAIGDLFFEDNKSLRSAVAVIDTYAGVNAALARQDYAGAALTLATGLANVAAINSTSRSGGQASGGAAPSSSDAGGEEFAPEQTGLSVTSNIDGEGFQRSQSVRFDVDDNEDFIESLADTLARKMATG